MLEKLLSDIKIDAERWKDHPRIKTSDQGVVPSAEKITPEMMERRNFRMNKPHILPHVYFNSEATRDTILHFANGYGDTNPLYINEDYAKKSKYGKIIAPPCFLYSVGWVTLGSGFPGIHGWYCGGDWEFYRPVPAGTRFMLPIAVIRHLDVKQGRKVSGGNIYIDYTDLIYTDRISGQVYGKELCHGVWAEREAAGSSSKERRTGKTEYSKEDWFRILEAYEQEEIRGNKLRYWEDVKVGDKLGPMIKGPLTVRDELAWLMGGGSPFFKAHKIELLWEKAHPKALEYVKETNEADVPELVHILDQYARNIGIEFAYDYGCQRMTWMSNLLTNWMGDDAFLWKFSGDLRAFNQMGDVTIFEGKVTKKYENTGKFCVDVETWAKNQREEWSMPPHTSTIILPTKEHGSIKYPDVPANVKEDVKKARPLNELIKSGLL